MSINDFFALVRKIPKALAARFMDYFFYLKPHPGLVLLYKLGLDIPLYSIPLFLSNNIGSYRKLKRLRRQGLDPMVILTSRESDGRFVRLHELARDPQYTEAVWFWFPIPTVLVMQFIFDSYIKRGCGYYEDARQKYIQPDNDDNRAAYREYQRRLYRAILGWLGRIDFFMMASNHDLFVVEMVAVWQEEFGTSFICCEREGTGTAYTYPNEARLMLQSKANRAHYIFTANENHRKMFEDSKMPSVRSVEMHGELDTDFWFHWVPQFTRRAYREWDKFDKKIMFLTFGTKNYIESYAFPNNPEMTWSRLLKEAEEEVFEFAQKNPDVLVFYKMGHREDNNPVFIQKCIDHGLKNVVPLERVFPCSELLLYCDATIGFQTTAMFEAMFTDKTLFYLDWAIPSCVDRKTMMLPIAETGGAKVMKSREQLGESLRKWALGDPEFNTVSPTERENRFKARELMFTGANGKTAERYLARISGLIEERKKNLQKDRP